MRDTEDADPGFGLRSHSTGQTIPERHGISTRDLLKEG